ncbi:unnamed protein product [Euphydryas editha]|uniref:Uncharacterized protein n=1 Tax=Euphydryas editha TaxID=104508 RepID=A0AAU9UTM0_EUPED|nr:unnamed protein product [Euphydryas editha]
MVKRTAAQVVNLALTTSSPRLIRMKKLHGTPSCSAIKFDSHMSKDYIHWQRGTKSRGANIYLAYNAIADAKKSYPNNTKILETEVLIPVHDILDHTLQRLAYVQQDVLLIHHDHTKKSPIEVIYK